MTDTSRKPKNMSGPLDEFTCAARVCRILEAQATDDAEIEQQIRDAQAKRKKQRQTDISDLMARCEKREHVAKLVLTRGLDLCGFELHTASNDTPPPADPPPEVPHRLGPEGPAPVTDGVEVDRESGAEGRRVGKGRA